MKFDFFLSGLAPEFLWTIVIISVVILANVAISAILRGRSWLSRETKLRGSVFWRNFSFLIALIALVFIWRSELRAAALSLAALSVALVLAGKELFTSVLGYIHRTTSRSFNFGDVIEINDIKGEVIDQTLLSTTVLEMSEEHLFTGRVVQFPNSFYVTHAMKRRVFGEELASEPSQFLNEMPLELMEDLSRGNSWLSFARGSTQIDYEHGEYRRGQAAGTGDDGRHHGGRAQGVRGGKAGRTFPQGARCGHAARR